MRWTLPIWFTSQLFGVMAWSLGDLSSEDDDLQASAGTTATRTPGMGWTLGMEGLDDELLDPAEGQAHVDGELTEPNHPPAEPPQMPLVEFPEVVLPQDLLLQPSMALALRPVWKLLGGDPDAEELGKESMDVSAEDFWGCGCSCACILYSFCAQRHQLPLMACGFGAASECKSLSMVLDQEPRVAFRLLPC